MNICEDRHEPKYEVKYKPAKGNQHSPVWLVCELCLETGPFGSDDYVESITKLEKMIQ
jgi:hypothetical protein